MVGEGLVTPMILKVVDQFVEGLDAKQLELNLGSGVATVNNVEIRKSAIDALDLPFVLVRGVCRTLKIQLPGYTAMASKPWRIDITDLILHVRSPLEEPYSEEEEKARVQRAKMAVVEAFEKQRRERQTNSAAQSSGFVSRQVEVITNNMIVNVNAVHFRYESEHAKTIVGAVLTDVEAHTIDELGKDNFLDPTKSDRVVKSIKFGGFRMYCDCGYQPDGSVMEIPFLSGASKEPRWLETMRAPITGGSLNGDSAEKTVFGPVVGDLSLTMIFKSHIAKLLDTPYMQLRSKLDNLVAVMTRSQYLGLLNVAAQWSNCSLLLPFRRYRPTEPVIGNAKKWWIYAKNCIVHKRRDAPIRILSALKKVQYMDAFDDLLVGHSRDGETDHDVITASNDERVKRIEEEMTAEDIIAVRTEVYQNASDHLKDLLKRKAEQEKNAGWFSGWSKTQEQKREEKIIGELQSTWGIVPDQEEAMDAELMKELPDWYCNMDLRLNLPSVGVTIVSDELVKPCDFRLHGTSLHFRQYKAPQSMDVDLVTTDLTVTNPTQSSDAVQYSISKHGSVTSIDGHTPEPLLKVMAKVNPVKQPIPDTVLDAQAVVQVQPLRIVADPLLLRSLQNFFDVPTTIDVSGLSDTTGKLASAVSNAASAQMASAISGSKTVDFKLNIGAPVILLPKRLAEVGDAMDTLCLSLGRFSFKSHPLTQSEKEKRIANAAVSTNVRDRYYSNDAKVSDLFVTLGTFANCMADASSGFSLVPNVTADIDVLTRMVPTDTSHHLARVSARVSELTARLSIHQAFILSSLVDTWFPPSAAIAAVEEMAEGGTDAAPEEPSSPTKSEDLPNVLVDLEVGRFGFLFFEDDAATKEPLRKHRFHLTAAPLQVNHETTTLTGVTRATLVNLTSSDMRDNTVLIGGGTQCVVDITSRPQEPFSVAIALQNSMDCHLGTPLIEFIEHIIDISNLFKPTTPQQAAPGDSSAVASVEFDPSSGTSRPRTSDEKNSAGDLVGTSIQLTIDNASIILYDRPSKASEDVRFASLAVTGTSLSVDMRQKTMDVGGSLVSANLICFTDAKDVPILCGSGSPDAPIVSFSYITCDRPVPIVVSEGELKTPTELLDFFNFVSVTVRPAKVTYDAYVVMVLLEYFTTGFMSRLAAVGGRKRYDGKDIYLPPAGPQVLMGMNIVVESPEVVLPLKNGTDEVLSARLKTLTVSNRLDQPSAKSTMTIALDNLLVNEESGGIRIVDETSMAMHMGSCLDPSRKEPGVMEIALPEVVLNVTSASYVKLLDLTASNILNMPAPKPKEEVAAASQGAKGDTPDSQTLIRLSAFQLKTYGSAHESLFDIAVNDLSVLLVGTRKEISLSSISTFDAKQNMNILESDAIKVALDTDGVNSLIDVDFGVKGLAVTNQWLQVADMLASPEAMRALQPMIGGKPAEDGDAAPKQDPNAATKISVVAHEFTIPMLNQECAELFRVHLTRIEVGLQLTKDATNVDAQLNSVSVQHLPSSLKLLSCDKQGEQGLLSVKCGVKDNTTSIDVGLEGLHSVLAMPALNELIAYATTPGEPLVELPKWGKKPEAEPVATEKKADDQPGGKLLLNLKWNSPTVTVPFDARPEAKSKTNGFDADLGLISVQFESDSGGMKVKAAMENTRMTDLLEDTSIDFAMATTSTSSEMAISINQATILASHDSLTNIMHALKCNLSLPPPKPKATPTEEKVAVVEEKPKVESAMKITVVSAGISCFDEQLFKFMTLSVGGLTIESRNSHQTVIVNHVRGVEHRTSHDVLKSSSGECAIVVNQDFENNETDVAVESIEFVVVPLAIGDAINLFLAPLSDAEDSSDAQEGEKKGVAAVQPSRTNVKLNTSTFVLTRESETLGVVTLDSTAVDLETHADGSATTSVVVGPVRLVDKLSKNSLFTTVLQSIDDKGQSEKFVEVTLVNYAPEASPTTGARFNQDVNVTVSSIAFVYVPRLISALSAAAADASAVISNAGKAKARAAKEAENIMAESKLIKKVNLVMNGPKLTLVNSTSARETIDVFPGKLTVTNALTTNAEGKELETFFTTIEGMEVKTLGAPTFHHSDAIRVSTVFYLDGGDMETNLKIPAVDLTFTEEQLHHVFLFGGLVMHPEETTQPTAVKVADSNSEEATPAAAADGSKPSTTSIIKLTLDDIKVVIGDNFNLGAHHVTYESTVSPTSTSSVIQTEGLSLAHSRAVLLSTGALAVQMNSSEGNSSLQVSLPDSTVGLSPQAVEDFSSTIYIPMCRKLLRTNESPEAQLTLRSESTTVLSENIDAGVFKFIEVTNDELCMFVLDLGGHELTLGGGLGAAIVIREGSKLLICNGTIRIKGMYGLSSFVHYAVNSTLAVDSETCKIVRESFPPALRNLHVDPAARETTHQTRITFQTTLQLVADDTGSTEVGLLLRGNADVKDTMMGSTLSRRSVNLMVDRFATVDPLMLRETTLHANGEGSGAAPDMSITIPALEFCIRTYRIRRILRVVESISKSMGSLTGSSLPTAVVYEDEHDMTLTTKPRIGKCKLCGESQARLGTGTDTSGVWCYSCALNLTNLTVPQLSVNLPLVDLVLIGSEGEMIELMLQKMSFKLSSSRDFNASVAVDMMLYNRKFAVWEPFIEHSVIEASGNIEKNEWKVDGGKLMLVPSVFSIQHLSSLPEELAAAKIEQTLVPVVVHNHTPSNIVLDKEHTIQANGNMQFEIERTKRNVELLYGAQELDLLIDRTSFAATSDCIAEVDVRMDRTTVKLIPFHSSGGIIRISSHVSRALYYEDVRIAPHSSVYLSANVSLDTNFIFRPENAANEDYLGTETTRATVGVPSFRAYLEGHRPLVDCESASNRNNKLSFRVVAKCDGMASGVPIYTISIHGAISVQNCTPCSLEVSLSSSKNVPLTSMLMDGGEKVEVYHADSISGTRISMQMAQGKDVFLTEGFVLNEDTEEGGVYLRSPTSERELLLQIRIGDGMIAISTPFAIINHTNLPLQIIEADTNSSKANFREIPPEMDVPICASSRRNVDELTVHVIFSKFKTTTEVPLQVLGTVGAIEMLDTSTMDATMLSYSTQMTPHGTRLVTITPRWVIVNRAETTLYLAQALGLSSSKNATPVEARTSKHFYPVARRANREEDVCLSVGLDAVCDPTQAFTIESPYDGIIVARGQGGLQPLNLNVSVIPQGNFTYIVLDYPKDPPFVFANRTPFEVKLIDPSFFTDEIIVAPFARRAFPFSTAGQTDLLKIVFGDETMMINVHSELAPDQQRNDANVVLKIDRASAWQSILSLNVKGRSTESLVLPPPPPDLSVAANFKLISISLVNHPIEIIHAAVTKVHLSIKRKKDKEVTHFSIDNFQIDNQTEEEPPFPCAALPNRPDKTNAPAISFYLDRDIVEAKNVVVIREVRISIDEIILRVSDGLLLRLRQFSDAFAEDRAIDTTFPDSEKTFQSAPSTAGAMASLVSVDKMVANPVLLRLWFERERNVDFVQDVAQSKLVSLFAISCEDVKISAPGLTVKDQKQRAFTLVKRYSEQYINRLKGGATSIVLQYASAMPLLGAPIKIVSDVSSGAFHFFADPIDGLTESPEAFAMGLARGTRSLVGGVFGGAFGAVSNVTGTVAKGADKLTFNKKRPGDTSRTNTVTGVVKGVAGLFVKPVDGFREDGAKGLMKGMGKGIVGVVANPLAGIMSDVATATSTVAETVAGDNRSSTTRMRPCRRFHAGGGVAAFGTLVETFEHERKHRGGGRWTHSMLTEDGPAWYPGRPEELAKRHNAQQSDWRLDRSRECIFGGWQHAEDYGGPYHQLIYGDDKMRRRRWVLETKARPQSRVAPLIARVSLDSVDSFAAGTPVSPATPAMASRGLAPSQPEQTARIVEVYENQRWYPIKSWSTSLLPTDRQNWSRRDGGRCPDKDHHVLPDGWEWGDEWRVLGGDKDGWEYAIDFGLAYSPKNSRGMCVRRRCWRRTMKPKK